MTKGMNNIEVRISNRKSIIAALYQHGGMTRQAIARSLDLSLPTVSVILKDLTVQGLVSPGPALESSIYPPGPNQSVRHAGTILQAGDLCRHTGLLGQFADAGQAVHPGHSGRSVSFSWFRHVASGHHQLRSDQSRLCYCARCAKPGSSESGRQSPR
jgi:hypothetical protein